MHKHLSLPQLDKLAHTFDSSVGSTNSSTSYYRNQNSSHLPTCFTHPIVCPNALRSALFPPRLHKRRSQEFQPSLTVHPFIKRGANTEQLLEKEKDVLQCGAIVGIHAIRSTSIHPIGAMFGIHEVAPFRGRSQPFLRRAHPAVLSFLSFLLFCQSVRANITDPRPIHWNTVRADHAPTLGNEAFERAPRRKVSESAFPACWQGWPPTLKKKNEYRHRSVHVR